MTLNNNERRYSLFNVIDRDSTSPSLSFPFMQGDNAMMLNEKVHQICLPICFFICYAYLILFSTDYPITMTFLCIIAIVFNFEYVRNFIQNIVVTWLLPSCEINEDFSTEGKVSTSPSASATVTPPSSPRKESFHSPSSSMPFYSSNDFWKFAGLGASIHHSSNPNTSGERNSSTFSTTNSADTSSLVAKRQRVVEVCTCKVMIVINIAVFFLRLLLCTKDYTVGWLMIGFLSSTVHNYSYIILQNALVDCRVHSFEAIMWAILPHHFISFGTAFILAFTYQRYVEAFGTFCLLIVLNFMLNSVSYKLMNRLNTMKLMTSKLKEANRSKNALVSSISHEFRSPLMSISGSIELLLDTSLNSEQINYIKTIGSCSSILLTLIEDILQYSKLEKTNLEIATNSMLGKAMKDEENTSENYRVFSLNDCLDHVKSIATSYASNFDVNIEFVASKFLPSYVLGESVRLQQVLINLLTNSIKASSKDQTITLSIEVPEDDDFEDVVDDGRSDVKEIIVVSPKEKTELENLANENIRSDDPVLTKTVLFRVIDHGCGIPKDIQQLLFKPFSTHSRGRDNVIMGTGLGLTIARKIITNMKGGISYRTSCEPPNNGTTFCVSIPFFLPDRKKKNSLRQIEEILRTHPIVTNPVSAIEPNSTVNINQSDVESPNLSKLLEHRLKEEDLISGVNNIDSEVQKNHLLHKELYIMRKRQTTRTNSQQRLDTENPPEVATIVSHSAKEEKQGEEEDIFNTKILLAEDNPINLSVLKKLLIKGGFKNITTSTNGYELVEAFKKDYHNIIVTDLHMPVSFNIHI